MTRGRKIALAFAALVPFCAACAFWLNRVSEPEYNGVKLGFYLTNRVSGQHHQAFEALAGLGVRAVPYLLDQMAPNTAYELMFKIEPKLPVSFQKLVPERRKYNHRRTTAAIFLSQLDRDAIDALPYALAAVERKDLVVLDSCMGIIGWLAPGTPYELRTVNALISLAEDQTPHSLVPAHTRRSAIGWLQR